MTFLNFSIVVEIPVPSSVFNVKQIRKYKPVLFCKLKSLKKDEFAIYIWFVAFLNK